MADAGASSGVEAVPELLSEIATIRTLKNELQAQLKEMEEEEQRKLATLNALVGGPAAAPSVSFVLFGSVLRRSSALE